MSAALCRKCGTPDCGHKRGGYSRAMALTADHQRLARSHVKRESLQRAGSLGFKGLVEKRGFNAAAEIAATWRRAHPSAIQLAVRQWLSELGEYFLEDTHLKYGYYPDFNLPARSSIVEVDGRGFHECSAWLGEDRAQRDAMKDRVYAGEGFRVLRLPEQAVRDGSGKQLMVSFLARDYPPTIHPAVSLHDPIGSDVQAR